MSKKHIVIGLGGIIFLYTAINQIPMISKNLLRYIKDLGLIIGVTFIVLWLIYLYEK